MAERRLTLELRLVGAALWRHRATMLLALTATAIGSALVSTLLHVSAGAGPGVAGQLAALGPNLMVAPRAEPGTADLDAAAVARRLEAAGIRDAVPVLYTVAELSGEAVPVAGADLAAVRRLHPAWQVAGDGGAALVGARLARRLAIAPGERVQLEARTGPVTVGPVGRLETGAAEDEMVWVPLETARRLAGRPGRASLFQARVAGGEGAVAAAARAVEADPGLAALPLSALGAAESRLLDRTKRLLGLLTTATLAAAGLCTLGTLTDLALERRRDVALLKALGASRADIIRIFAAESAALGLAGGAAGWAVGAALAQLVGRQVFHTPIPPHWETLPLVVGIALLVALAAAIGPVRFALGLEPAPALQGE